MSRRDTVSRISVYEKPAKKTSGSRTTPTKKFATRAEEFCDWMTSLGYKIPKHVKAEHFDYIFQHDDTARIARQLMKLIKPANALSSQEVASFEKLKEDGRVLYGVELEAAYNRQKNLELEKAQKNENIIARRRAMDQAIEETKAEVDYITQHDELLAKQIVRFEEKEAIRESQKHLEKQIEEQYDKVIQLKMDHIANLNNVLQEKLKNLHSKFVGCVELKKPAHLCDFEWNRLVEDEERLNILIKGMFEKHGSDMLRQDLGVEDALDTLQSEMMYRTFKQHETHLERLKHMIIFERVREMELDIELAATKKVLKSMDSIASHAKLIFQSEPHIQDRMLREMQKNSETLEKMARLESSAFIESIRQEEVTKRNDEIKCLVDQRVFAKRKQREFVSFLVNILVHQRIRMDVIRELIRAERAKNLQFHRTLHHYTEWLIDLAEKEENIRKELQGPPSVDPELLTLLQKSGIPISVYRHPLTTYQALHAIRADQEREKSIQEKRAEAELLRKLRKNLDRVDYLQTFLRNAKSTATARNPVEETIAQLENAHAEMEKELESHQRNKNRFAQESRSKKLQQLEEIQQLLTKHNNNAKTKGNIHHHQHASLL